MPTKIVEPKYITHGGKRYNPRHNKSTPGLTRAQSRALTYPGIAEAMAEQWGG